VEEESRPEKASAMIAPAVVMTDPCSIKRRNGTDVLSTQD